MWRNVCIYVIGEHRVSGQEKADGLVIDGSVVVADEVVLDLLMLLLSG